jgi:putative ABC transport system substrate-binding protein
VKLPRRKFLHLAAGAAALPIVAPMARAQQRALPVIGYLGSQSLENEIRRRAFRQGLKDSGYVEGENVTVEYRFAGDQMDQLPELLAEIQRRGVAVIVATSGPIAAVAAKSSTAIPIVFMVPEDPVRLGLVTSLARPGGNLTGINFFATELVEKRLGLLRTLVPAAARVAVLINPAEATIAESTLREVESAARTTGLQIQIFRASTSGEINAAFAAIARERPDALFIGSGPFFGARRTQLVNLASRHAIPAIYASRPFPEAGGLMSYGSDIQDRYRQAGIYAGRILKGAKPADLPVVQSTKFELVINLETARLLDLTVPPTLLAIADALIE